VEELAVLDEFCAHGRAIREERERAATLGQAPGLARLVRSWGGVTIAYRKTLQDSPAYRLNHEEVVKALEEGVEFAENLNPIEAVADHRGAVVALTCARTGTHGGNDVVTLPARSVLVAAGTTPNTTCEKEAPGRFRLDGKQRFFEPHRAERDSEGRWYLAPDADGFFTSYDRGGRFVSFFGDNHPRYAGNVVKAMASAKHGFPRIVELFARDLQTLDPAQQDRRDESWHRLLARLDDELSARVHDIVRLTPTIVELIVRAPAAAQRFEPGQFYRLQNYESFAARVKGGGVEVPLLMEGVALTGASVDKDRGLLSLIALELGVSSRLIAHLRQGDPVVVMGPTGAPTVIPDRQSILLLGGGLGNAVLFSIARALRDRRNAVVYFAGYKRGEDLFKREEIEISTDQVIWSTEGGAPIVPARPQDAHFRGNIVHALLAYRAGELGRPLVPLDTVNRVIAIGSDRMMNAVRAARHGVLAPYLKPGHVAVASVNSPMQCMMKEVCAQCLQKHVDGATGRETFVFSCFNQDQDMDRVDFANLAARLRQNTVQEKLSAMWLDHLLSKESRRA
jgi:NAD(P)H-flavin reductase